VTLNNTRVPPPGEEPRLEGTTTNVYHTNGRLWTVLWPEGTVRERPRGDGSIEMKFPWWRGARGELRITGRRLDAPAPALRARVPDGYGAIGFQSSAVIFPTGGCWRVTGMAGEASLRFVTLVAGPPRRQTRLRAGAAPERRSAEGCNRGVRF
jgi:hypothetical protein